MESKSIHERWMARCITLAYKGLGQVAPNPMVGAVLVYNDKIIGEGWHEQYGAPHAEVNCINNVANVDKHLIPLSTLYVSLEPCTHHGKTPPCVDLIIKNNIPKVVIGCTDTFSKVNGKGIALLRDENIDVVTAVMQKECRILNKRFFTFHELHRPYVILKWAESNNGFFCPKDKKPLMMSNSYSQRFVHKMRSEEAGILIGFQTALNDNANLNNRLWNGNSPTRIILDYNDDLPTSLNVFNGKEKTILITGKQSKKTNCIIKKIEENSIAKIVKAICDEGLQSIIVEGGIKTLQAFIDYGYWDEALIIKSQICIEDGISAPILRGAMLNQENYIAGDNHRHFINKKAATYFGIHV